MRQLVLVLASVVSTAAFLAYCGGVPGAGGDEPPGTVCDCAPATVRSGTRLKARVAVSEDGASQFLGWWDTELGTRCGVVDGTGFAGDPSEPVRCVPLRVGAVSTGPNVLYADSSCTKFGVRVDWQSRAHGVRFCALFPEGEPSKQTYYPLGEQVPQTDAARRYRVNDEGECVEAEALNPEGFTIHTCGDLEPVPVESFALFHQEVEGLD